MAANDRTFSDLGVPATLVAALTDLGITDPFPIQAATLPDSLAGRDVLGRGRTGSGKTLAFALPLLTRLAASSTARQPRRPRALVLAPTRELAGQIEGAMRPLARRLGLRTITVFGGVSAQPQIAGLRGGVDVVIACPGRLTDHVRSGHADLSQVEITVLDEADHMADLGFLPVVRRLMDLTPSAGQRLMFSATLDRGVDGLVRGFLRDPVQHSVDPESSPVSTMTHHVLHVSAEDRVAVLADLTAAPGRTVVFTRTKHRAKALARQLVARGVPAVDLHGDLSQGRRTRHLAAFSSGAATTLVATDIAARGLHVDDVALVIHADPPVEHKAYLHRSGRTARAGADGTVVTLMLDDQVRDVQQLARRAGIRPSINRVRPDDELLARIAPGERAHVVPTPAADQVPGRPRSKPGRRSRGQQARRGAPRRAGAAPARRQSTPSGSRSHSAAGFSASRSR